MPRSRIMPHPERLPRQCPILMPTLGVSAPVARIGNPKKSSRVSRGSLPKPGLGLILVLSSTEVGTQSPAHAKTSMPRSRIMFRGLPLRRLPRQCAYRCFGTAPKSSRLRAHRPIDVPRVQFFRFQGKLLGSIPPGLSSETKARARTSACAGLYVATSVLMMPTSVRYLTLALAYVHRHFIRGTQTFGDRWYAINYRCLPT